MATVEFVDDFHARVTIRAIHGKTQHKALAINLQAAIGKERLAQIEADRRSTTEREPA